MSQPAATKSSPVLKRALTAIDRLQRELEAARRGRTEPIAVVSVGCRFPGGVHDADSYWRLLAEGVDAIREVPADRWDTDAYYHPQVGRPGKMTTKWGGFLDRIDEFDAAFFGISPREAEAMDPNQRLVLEVAWEALENAGYADLAGSRTGVFVGVINSDYGLQRFSRPDDLTPYAVTGTAHSIVSGRLAYLLDLRGPAVSIDTACSSSLLAVHLACQSLRTGDCDMALAGGVNVILSPLATIGFSQFGMMSPDGRCRTFDAGANGFVRGEGCGIVVLKRLSDAVAAGDEVLAVIRGGAVNQDGRSTGLTAPNVLSQRELLRRALETSGVEAGQVSYVEAHGTGTTLGDPIEVEALADVYPAAPGAEWHLGSVKTNFGHLEAAAGIAGLIKVVLALRHRSIPPHLHFERLNPHIAVDRPPFAVPTELTEWTPRDGRRIAGVSAFGLSGTNVHLLVEEGPGRAPATADERRPLNVLALSARSEAGLRLLVERHRDRLGRAAQAPVADHCYSANTGRSHFPHRLAVVGGSAAELDAALAGVLDRSAPNGAASTDGREPEVAFLYSGAGTERPGMAHALYESAPVFREALDRCHELLRGDLDVPLLDVLFPKDPGTPHLDRPTLAQPALFAVQYALTELWHAWGVRPAAVFGHGPGEIAAAHTAGVMSLEDALRLVTRRARLHLPSDATPVETDLASLRQTADGISQSPPRIPFVSGLDGALWPWDEAPDAEHWCRQVHRPVRFADAVSTLRSLGYTRFVEIGPDAALVDRIRAEQPGDELLTAPSLRPGEDDWRTVLSTLAELYEHGTDVDWAGFDRGYARTRVPVPTSPFVRTRHWYDAPAATVAMTAGDEAGREETTAAGERTATGESTTASAADSSLLTREDLLALKEDERFDILADHLARGVGAALGSGSGPRRRSGAATVEVGLDQPLLDLGLDSLMATGLRVQIRDRLGVTLPLVALLKGASVRRVAEQVLEQLEDEQPEDDAETGTEEAPGDDTEALLAELTRLPEAEARALLEEGR
ncbi:beta-ketoacyl synthase N-terminal-like domain-containing protein [Streptomyces sp. NPDC052051]|uniref:type I polyketide synthase n=1 Tax=Streptomyces sp. NPDC052051 TaxID=3154649 RepID=UPI0034237427